MTTLKSFLIQWLFLTTGWILLWRQEFEWALFPYAFWLFYMILSALRLTKEQRAVVFEKPFLHMNIALALFILFLFTIRGIYSSPFLAAVNYLSLIAVALSISIVYRRLED